jgi:hypothetical protein
MKEWTSLGLGVTTILIVWLLVLPWVGSQEPIASQIDALDRQGIDPAALFYTDLDAMSRVESGINAITRSHHQAFWSAGPAGKPRDAVDRSRRTDFSPLPAETTD